MSDYRKQIRINIKSLPNNELHPYVLKLTEECIGFINDTITTGNRSHRISRLKHNIIVIDYAIRDDGVRAYNAGILGNEYTPIFNTTIENLLDRIKFDAEKLETGYFVNDPLGLKIAHKSVKDNLEYLLKELYNA